MDVQPLETHWTRLLHCNVLAREADGEPTVSPQGMGSAERLPRGMVVLAVCLAVCLAVAAVVYLVHAPEIAGAPVSGRYVGATPRALLA